MNPFGDGSQGALNVTSGTTYLPLNTKLQYTTVNVSSGATLSTNSTTGAVLYILATESITINGTINVSNKVDYGNNTWGVTIDGENYSSPGVANGGYGDIYTGQTRAFQSAGFGGGGSGVGITLLSGTTYRAGNGGVGSTSAAGGGAVSVARTSNGTSSNRNDAARVNGGSGVAYAYRQGTNYTGTTSATGGSGGQGYGANGADGSGSHTHTGGSGSYNWYGGGGGGGGGRAGRSGVHVVLKAPSITINGTIITSGTSGGNGGNGGRSRTLDGWRDFWGMPGGGGGGGSGGDIQLVYNDTINTTGTLTRSGGSGGNKGIGGVGNTSEWAQDGSSGLPGSLNTTQTAPIANFTANTTSGARPLAVQFTNLSSGGDTFSWNFGDSSGSSQENPTHTYTSVGTFTVTLTVTNSVGSTTVTKSNYIVTTINDFSRTAGGTLLLGGGTARRLLASRTAGGTLVFGGDTRIVVIRDAEVIQDKTYLYKVYDPEGNYIETWKDVIDELNFTHEINTIGSTTTLQLARNSDTVGVVTSPLLDEDDEKITTEDDQDILVATESRNQIGSGSSVDYDNRVDITAYYGSVEPLLTESMDDILTEDDEQLLADLGAPNGRRVFTGFISEINSRYGNTETTVVQLTSFGWDLDQFPVTTAYNNDVTTVPFNSTDPSDIVSTAIERFEQRAALDQVSYTTKTTTSIQTSGTTVSYTFRNNTYKDLLDKTLELLPANWFYRIGLGDNVVYLRQTNTNADHVFYLGKHIKALDLKGSTLSVVNNVLFTGGGDPALYIQRKVTPASRTRRGLEVISDARVTLTDSAGIIADGKISEGNKIQYRTTVEILSKQYDIESIAVGDTVGFRNFGSYVDDLNMNIVGLSYTPDVVQLQLETKPLTINKRLEDVRRNLVVTENQNIPTSPS